MQVIVPTGGRGHGVPTHYKIDVGNPTLKVAIEVDGMSHCALSRREQDKIKEKFLLRQGWRVLRFTNREVTSNLRACVQTVLAIL